MKKYNVQIIDGEKIISYTRGNIKVSFGEWQGNSDYAEYLRYEAWVAEGNEPEDFWTQEGGI